MKNIFKIIYNNLFNGCHIYSTRINGNVKFFGHNTIGRHVKIRKNVEIGEYSYINSEMDWTIIEGPCRIGKYCSIGPGVTIGLFEHNYKYVSTHPILFNKRYGFIESDIKVTNDERITTIGNDVWIGANSIIRRGINIGDGAVIAMGGVVVKDVPPYAIVGGNPARIIKYRFEEQDIEQLLKIKWWDLEEKEIIKNINNMYDIKDYIKSLQTNKND